MVFATEHYLVMVRGCEEITAVGRNGHMLWGRDVRGVDRKNSLGHARADGDAESGFLQEFAGEARLWRFAALYFPARQFPFLAFIAEKENFQLGVPGAA